MGVSRNIKQTSGLTLVEVMVATAVVMVIVLGGMGYLCTSARLAREADRMSTAMHLALLLLESWRERRTCTRQARLACGLRSPRDVRWGRHGCCYRRIFA